MVTPWVQRGLRKLACRTPSCHQMSREAEGLRSDFPHTAKWSGWRLPDMLYLWTPTSVKVMISWRESNYFPPQGAKHYCPIRKSSCVKTQEAYRPRCIQSVACAVRGGGTPGRWFQVLAREYLIGVPLLQADGHETRIKGFRSRFSALVMSSNFDCDANNHCPLE